MSCNRNDPLKQFLPKSASNEVLEAASREAAVLTDREREKILEVLTKDEILRNGQQLKILHLKAELQQLRRRGAIKVSNDWNQTGPDPSRTCNRCREVFGRVFNRGADCSSCRLRVCKNCREYNFTGSDWVCIVCFKRMEIQAASGEWMNEFVRRPSRRKDAKVYVPAADIIKRTIRRSWTISNPTPRWTVFRNSTEYRPYSSLPRDQDINNYPSLARHQIKNVKNINSSSSSLPSSTRRTKSEDVYMDDQNESSVPSAIVENDFFNAENETLARRPLNTKTTRVNPLMSISLRENKGNRQKRKSPSHQHFCYSNSSVDRDNEQRPDDDDTGEKGKGTSQAYSTSSQSSLEYSIGNFENDNFEKNDIHSMPPEKENQNIFIGRRHVSFDHPKVDTNDINYFRSQSLSSTPNKRAAKEIRRKMPFSISRSLPDDGCSNNNCSINNNNNNHVKEEVTSAVEVHNSNDNGTIELCDIEPLSGTVFRKMTVSRRKQENLRKMPAVDAGWRKTPEKTDLFDILLPDGEDYRLVFVNSDSSSKEEDIDDNDSSTSASSFPIDECDWDYFEPGAGSRSARLPSSAFTLEVNSQSPFGSPRVYRKKIDNSPLGSPNFIRRSNIRHASGEEDEDDDDDDEEAEEENRNIPSPFEIGPLRSATIESIEALQCVHQHQQNTIGQQTDQNTHPVTSCKTCGGSSMPTAQYIPIPVPVPVPFPVPWGTSSSIDTSGSNLVPLYRSLPNLTRGNAQQSLNDFWQYFAQMQVGFPWNLLEKQMINEHNNTSMDESETTKKKDNENKDNQTKDDDRNEVFKDEPTGYLESENRRSTESSYDSSADESLSSSAEQHQIIKRVYNISGSPTDRDSDDALPTSSTVSSDNDDIIDQCQSSADEKEREDGYDDDVASSSGSADTDSNDTGTVADQKSKRFSRVFIVNNKDSSDSSASIVTSSGDNNTDSSDNDTDLDADCNGVVLTNIKQIDLEVINHQQLDECGKSEKAGTETDGTATFLSIRYIGEDDECVTTPPSPMTSTKNAILKDRKTKKKTNRSRRHGKASKRNEPNDDDTLENEEHDCDKLGKRHDNRINKREYCLSKRTVEEEEMRSSEASVDTSCDNKINQVLDVIIDSKMIPPVSENIRSAVGKRNHLDIGNFNVEIDGEQEEKGKEHISEAKNDERKLDNDINELSLLEKTDSETNNQNHQIGGEQAVVENINYGTQTEPPPINHHFYFNDNSTNNNMYSSSPGLSDVSAESLSSSDAEKEENSRTRNRKLEWGNEIAAIATTASLMKPTETLPATTTRAAAIDESIKVVNEKRIGRNLPNDDDACSVGNSHRQHSVNSNDNDSLVNSSSKYSVDNRLNQHGTTAATISPPSVSTVAAAAAAAAASKYTSLVMIRNDAITTSTNSHYHHQQVNVVTSDTTKVIPGGGSSSASAVGSDREQVVVVVSHTNRQNDDHSTPMDTHNLIVDNESPHQHHPENNVTVITSAETLSAFEEGLADDDSWVENLSYGDEDEEDEEEEEEDDDFPTNSLSDNSSSGDEVTLTCSAAIDQEDELRGYHRAAIDFTLHTIVEESCEESEVEQVPPTKKKERPASATDLEKYFFFRLGDGTVPSSIGSNREDAYSETSSIYSEGMESLGGTEESHQNENPEELASSRLEKYFLSGFMGFTAERRDSDGSVGSDSEGKPSPEQRRKRLVRARGTGRSHSSSLDNLLANPDLAVSDQQLDVQNNSENSSNSDSDTYDEMLNFDKSDGQFDTVKRKKGKKQKASSEDIKNLETTQEEQEDKESDIDDERNKTPQPEVLASNLTTNKNQQSRDSGFVGSCDDLLKDQRDVNKSPEVSLNNEKTPLNVVAEKKEERTVTESFPPATNLTRKDSFNNWSSDEETNLMMSKMRQFFKTMVANNAESSSKPSTPNLSNHASPKPIPRTDIKTRSKPPQLVYFENELTRLMKTVPGIRDDQVREIVEYLSSEDTWSDSYDSSDYTSSDLEGASNKSALQQQISDSCKEIINKFDSNVEDEEGDAGDGGIVDDGHGMNKETAFVYQKLVASFEKMATEDRPPSNSGPNSPPLIAKVMHHIGSRLVALMHEVSSGESHSSSSPRVKNYHRKLQPKLSNASTTTDDDASDNISEKLLAESTVRNNCNMLLRSRSHDLLIAESSKNIHQSIGGTSEISEERETSDCERFSWRGSFESALLAADSRNKLSLIGGEGSASASALAIAAKRRSAGDLLFSNKSLSREQLDRVRSCGSIGGGNSEDKLWVAPAVKSSRRRSSVPDTASCESGASADGEDEDDEMENRATLPRSIQSGPQTTNSLPRLPTTSITSLQKAQSHHFLPQQNAKSARYRPPGFSRLIPSQPKRAVSAPGLQPSHQRRGRRSQINYVPSDDVSLSEAHSSPMLASSRAPSKSASPSPVAPSSRRTTGSASSQEWTSNDDDIERLVAMHNTRSSLSSLGLRSDSMASVYSGAGEGRYGSVTVRGQVEFGLQYNYKSGSLEIQIKQCKDLAPVDSKRNRSDPYVKVYLLPDKSKSGKRKTKVKKHTLNPVFDECLKFHMSLNELELRTLWLTVWHSDMFGRNDFLGEVMMTLENKVFDDPTPKWYNLQERTEPFDDILSFKGDIIVCLKFVPPDMTVHKKGKRSRGSLHVLIKEAKALTAVKANGTSDPFCKSYLLPDKGRSSKQKTPVAKRTVNPIWNHTFIYDDVTLQELAERCLELTVWDHDRLASNEFLGGIRFSLGTGKHYGKVVEWMDASGKEVSLWKSMLERPNFWVEGSLSLRPTLDTRAC